MLVRSFVIAFFLGTPLLAHASFDACLDYFPGKAVPVVQGDRLREICFDSFAVLHSGKTKTPVYAVERLSRKRLLDAKDETRTDKFYEEARLPKADRATLADFKGSGYDRGHLEYTPENIMC